jgi:hypothetical protein
MDINGLLIHYKPSLDRIKYQESPSHSTSRQSEVQLRTDAYATSLLHIECDTDQMCVLAHLFPSGNARGGIVAVEPEVVIDSVDVETSGTLVDSEVHSEQDGLSAKDLSLVNKYNWFSVKREIKLTESE